MTHRYGCPMPAPESTTTHLALTGATVRIDRCPTCGATALHREDTR